MIDLHKCPQCDVTVQTITSIVLWLDVVVCGCALLVQLSEAQADTCLNKSTDCSFHYRIGALLCMNIIVALVAVYGVRKKIPTLLFPYTIFKLLVIILTVIVSIFWKQLTDLYPWIPSSRFDILTGVSCFIIFAFQIYAAFIMAWCYQKTVRMLAACRTAKSFKSVVSIWIGDDSRTKIYSNNESTDSTCIIETSR